MSKPVIHGPPSRSAPETGAVDGIPPRYNVTHATMEALTRIERARGYLEAAKLSDEWIRRMGERAMLLEAHHTTHIEGTQLTLEESARLMAGEAVPEADPDDARELLNYRGAFELVAEWLDEGGPITEGVVKEIHRQLVDGVRGGAAKPGEYRREQNCVMNMTTFEVVYRPPHPDAVPGMMDELITWLNGPGDIHPVLLSGVAQFQFVHIHPFLDGNGRTSRLLSTLCLYRAGYDFKRLFTISEFYDRDRATFYKKIQDVRDNGMDLTGWLEYYATGLATQLDETKTLGEHALLKEHLMRRHDLSDRQALAVDRVLEIGKLTISDYEKLCPDVNRRTLQRDLKALVAADVFVEAGNGPTDPTRHYCLKEIQPAL
jgi:Fic family protein